MRKDPSLSLANVPLASSVCGPTRTAHAPAPQRLSRLYEHHLSASLALLSHDASMATVPSRAHNRACRTPLVIPQAYLTNHARRLARPIRLYGRPPSFNSYPLFSSHRDWLTTFTIMWSLPAMRRAYCAVSGRRVRCAPGCGGQPLPVKNALLLMHYR